MMPKLSIILNILGKILNGNSLEYTLMTVLAEQIRKSEKSLIV